MLDMLRAWRDQPDTMMSTLLPSPEAPAVRTDMLKKLGAEELALNISLGKMSAEWKAAMEGWLDSESTYRLRIEQAKEARQGAKFAEQEYEKYREAHKEAKNNYEV